MTEPDRRRRKMTARAAAEKFGVSIRTVQRVVAEERAVYEQAAADRRAQIIDLYRRGLKQKAIAAQLGVTPALVSIRIREAREAGVDLSLLPDDGNGNVSAD
ncbi:helix-turn-helix domain-containing protein [Gordonia alkaliphila]